MSAKHTLALARYVPLRRQRLLEYVVLDPLANREEIFDSAPVEPAPTSDWATAFVEIPIMSQIPAAEDTHSEPDAGLTLVAKTDFAERDAHNRKLGRSGEEWVVELEKERLKAAGRADLASRVDWIADRIGDGHGYDVVSFDEDGEEVYIEVKTTNAGARTPFFISPRELSVAGKKRQRYRLYRVFDFGQQPRVFVISGPLDERLQLKARAYSAIPKASAIGASPE